MRKKHVPLRTCVGCGEGGAKRELIRIVRHPDGSIAVDLHGKEPGRGAYIHRRAECWRKALDNTRLAHVLKASPTPEERGKLEDQLKLLELEEHLTRESPTNSGASGAPPNA